MKMFDREVVVAFKGGSHIRNLQNENSDEDWKYFVLPTQEDLFSAQVFQNSQTSETIDIEVQDVRKLDKLLFKSNPASLDLLFSPQIEYFGHEEIWEILKMKDEIATMNLSSFFDSSMGMFNQNMKSLCRINSQSSEKTVALIKKYGYNPKKAMMNMHLSSSLLKFYRSGFKNYGEAIWYEGTEKDFMLNVKNGKYKLDDMENMLAMAEMRMEALKGYYKEHPVNEETHKKLQQLLRQLVFRTMDCNIPVK